MLDNILHQELHYFSQTTLTRSSTQNEARAMQSRLARREKRKFKRYKN